MSALLPFYLLKALKILANENYIYLALLLEQVLNPFDSETLPL